MTTEGAQSATRLFAPLVIVFATPELIDMVVILYEVEEGRAIILMTIGATFMALIARVTH